tara:strand:- start:283 stop:624 length:342 start_codon:yes stop_codon:yes gene_type:complete
LDFTKRGKKINLAQDWRRQHKKDKGLYLSAEVWPQRLFLDGTGPILPQRNPPNFASTKQQRPKLQKASHKGQPKPFSETPRKALKSLYAGGLAVQKEAAESKALTQTEEQKCR